MTPPARTGRIADRRIAMRAAAWGNEGTGVMRVERQLWFWVGALVVLVLAIALLRDILLPFVAAVVVAYFLNPIADRLQGYGLNRTWAAILVVGVVAVLVALALLLLVPVVVFYLLVDWHPMLERLDDALPRDYAATIRRLAVGINDAVAAFIRGQGTICLVLGVFYAIGLSWAGIDYGLLVGLSTGLLAFVPIVGWVLGLIFAAGLAIVQFWPDPAPLLKAVGVLVGGIAIDTAFLSPRFVGQKIGLHPVWMIFALFVFSYLFGLVGTLVAVPLAAAIGVLVRFAVQQYLDSSLYKGSGAAAEGSAVPVVEDRP